MYHVISKAFSISKNTAAVTNKLLYLVLLITSPHEPHRKHRSSVAVYEPLPSNGSCIVSYCAVVA
jgi:hypothetical protein